MNLVRPPVNKPEALPILRADQTDGPVLVKITSAIFRSKQHMVEVINLETRETQSMVVKTVLGNELHRAYPNNGVRRPLLCHQRVRTPERQAVLGIQD